MATDNETVAEIVCEMRERCIDEKHSPSLWPYLDRIESAHNREIAEKDEEIAELRERVKEAEEFAAEMKESTNSLVRACGHQMILRLRWEGGTK